MIVNRTISVEFDLAGLPFAEWPEEAKRIAYNMSPGMLRKIQSLRPVDRKAEVVRYVENRRPLTLAELIGELE